MNDIAKQVPEQREPDERKRQEARNRANQEFVERLAKRRPGTAAAHARLLEAVRAEAPRVSFEAVGEAPAALVPSAAQLTMETIVNAERPVLFVQGDWINKTEVTLIGEEAQELVNDVDARKDVLQPIMPLIGRIDVQNFPGLTFVGTGWFIAEDILVTNRHVASLIAKPDGRKFVFSRGVAGNVIVPSVCTAHEFDDLAPDKGRIFDVKEVLYIERDNGPNDIAFIRVNRRTDGARQGFITIAESDVKAEVPVLVVGYPARAPRSVIPDQALMKELYRDRYDVKRAAPGFTMSEERLTTRHDCTTLGGNSGSVVLDLKTGKAVGLHFAGLYQESNYAVRASVLTDYIKRKVWENPPLIESGRAPPSAKRSTPAAAVKQSVPSSASTQVSSASGASASITVPLTITFNIGAPITAAAPSSNREPPRFKVKPADAESAARDFWDQRPNGVIAVRVGFDDEGGVMGDTPFIAASVPAERLAAVSAAGPTQFQSLEVRYFPADASEIGEAVLESVTSISYDDDARTGAGFSFARVEEPMSVLAHVGPEYSWEVLQGFLGDAQQSLVSAIYEFHGSHIAGALEDRLKDGVSLELVMDNASFSNVKDEDEEFDRVETFNAWQRRFGDKFERIVAPEGVTGLISDSYHIKVTVREDDTFWLSSGNWKMGSSQPIITQEQRDNAADEDLPGNREWHVVIKNKTLAERFRNHIKQDFVRSHDLGGGVLPKSMEAVGDIWVDVPIEEVLERRAPSRVLKPRKFDGTIKVKPLLTPDGEGAVYSEAVLELIDSARESLLFQIPYIGMPPNPRSKRGFIDDLIKALAQKLKDLDDARLILRTGGNKLSAPTHAAWYFKSKGVEIASRVRQIENHHTKGMIVDGKRVLIGSHNWSMPGVTLNRDASLIFDDPGLAAYYAEAFEIDWERANPIKPKRFVRPESVVAEAAGVLEAVPGTSPPPGYRRVRLSELLEGDD
jgi:V8-like Glu-specific endopeptidase